MPISMNPEPWACHLPKPYQEFQVLSKQASSHAFVTDFIPLDEVVRVEFDIQAKDSGEQDDEADQPQSETSAEREEQRRGGVLGRLTRSAAAAARCTGLALKGAGRENNSIPEFDKYSHEVHLLLLTEEGTLNPRGSGRTARGMLGLHLSVSTILSSTARGMLGLDASHQLVPSAAKRLRPV